RTRPRPLVRTTRIDRYFREKFTESSVPKPHSRDTVLMGETLYSGAIVGYDGVGGRDQMLAGNRWNGQTGLPHGAGLGSGDRSADPAAGAAACRAFQLC